ncbi:CBS domain-containing protein [Opitutia bacterium ISCC 51]|nr:CBS domain-containing protein [Opitutae bacterium ISCC 51]QXD29518.1 CBS domain-containing protein [Opitutae bacterium ISCC 52]
MKVPVSTLLAEKKIKALFSLESSATVMEAVKEMNHRQVGSLIILDEGKLVGIFTERDVLRRVVVPGLPAETTSVADVMSKEVDTFGPETTVTDALAHMNDKRHRHIPIMEGEDILGLISIGDITRWLSANAQNEAQTLLNYFTGTYGE